MKRLFIVYDGGCSWSKKNATGIHILEVVNNIAKKHDIVLYGTKEKGESTITNSAFEIQYIPTFGTPIIRFTLYELILFIKLFFSQFNLKPDIIYTRSKAGLSSLVFSFIFKIPRIVEVNGITTDECRMAGQPALKIFIASKILEKVSYNFSSKIITVTDKLKEEIKKRYRIPDEKVVVIENGANTDLFKPMDRRKCIKELSLDESCHYVCFVGNLAPWQGTEYLIEAAPLVLDKVPNTKFLIVGDGIMKEKLLYLAKKAGISDKIIFTGAVPYEEVPKYINASDVGTAPFAKGRIASPLKIYEYLSCEKPVVSSRIPNLELIEQQNAGILIEPENPKKLAEAIMNLLKNEKLRNKMGKNGRKYVAKNHSWKMVTEKVESVISEIVEKVT